MLSLKIQEDKQALKGVQKQECSLGGSWIEGMKLAREEQESRQNEIANQKADLADEYESLVERALVRAKAERAP